MGNMGKWMALAGALAAALMTAGAARAGCAAHFYGDKIVVACEDGRVAVGHFMGNHAPLTYSDGSFGEAWIEGGMVRYTIPPRRQAQDGRDRAEDEREEKSRFKRGRSAYD